MSKIWSSLILIIIGCNSSFCTEYLQKEGKASYVIAIPENAHFTENRAAGELAEYLGKVTGVRYQILQENQLSGKKVIFVGQTERAKKEIDLASFQPEEWLIRTTNDGNLILTGGKYAGIYYAVVDYLERQAGIRWLDETCEIVPKNPFLQIGKWNLRRSPSFALRQVFDLLDWNPVSGHFKERNKGFSYTQYESGVSKYYGGKRPYHTAGEYAEDWPKDKAELFSSDDHGKILVPNVDGSGGGQICMSNLEARQRVLDKMLGYIKQDRLEAERKKCAPPWLYDFSPNDNGFKCNCDGCMSLAESEKSYAGATVDFINWIARRVREKYPEILVKTFAYTYCEKAPENLKTEPNVVIMLAQVGVEQGNAYNTYDTIRPLNHPVNQPTLEIFKKWRNHTDKIFHWQYWTIYPVTPQPVVRVNALFQDIEIDKKYNVKAFFAEYENPAFNSFSALTRYLAFKLTDNAQRDKKALLQEFMQGYYGPAAKYMLRLLEYMEERQATYPSALGSLETSERDYLDDKYFATTLGLLNQAEKAVAKNPDIIKRIRRERPCLLAGLLARWPHLKNHSPYNSEKLIEEFRIEAYRSMDYFFGEDKQQFRNSERYNQTIENLCIQFKSSTAEFTGAFPAGVYPNKDTEFICFNAGSFLYQAESKMINDPQAFGGKACYYEYGNENLNLILQNWMDGITLFKTPLTEVQLPKDGKYHWLFLGHVTFTNNGRSHLLIPDHSRGIRLEFYRRVKHGSSYDLYVSLKCDSRAISCDRVLLIKPQAISCNSSKKFVLPPEITKHPYEIIPAGKFHSNQSILEKETTTFDGSVWVNRNTGCAGGGEFIDFGIYDRSADGKYNFTYKHPKQSIKDEKYHLLKIGNLMLPEEKGSYFYCGSDWQIQCPIPPELLGKNGILYLLVKFTGPVFLPGSPSEHGFYVGGLLFVKDAETLKRINE